MNEHKIYICGNDETICDGCTDDRTDAWKDEIGTTFVDAAADIATKGGADYQTEHQFQDWHGGRFDQFYTRCALVAVSSDAPKWLIDLAWKAAGAGCEARDEYIAKLEAEADKFEAENAE